MSRYHTLVGLSVYLKQRALELGFDLVGIAPAFPAQDLEFAREWFDRGFAGDMAYLSNPKRFDPRAVLPSVRSVICLGLIYDTPYSYSTEVGQEDVSGQLSVDGHEGPRTRDDGRSPVSDSQFPVLGAAPPHAWISRYAWGRDYHEIMREKLELLRAGIEELAPGAETRVYVDTGPVPERAYVRFSGLGWMGKNTCIINEARGSFLFLGVILTNLALASDLPAPDRCGSCRACIDACPTGALVEPYVMDASRCISYLTIELKGSIPPELRPGVGANVFGCDICQDVCPWNRRSQESVRQPTDRSQESGFEPMSVSIQPSAVCNPQPSNHQSSIFNHQSSSPQHSAPRTFSLFHPALEALASMTEEDFRQAFRHSPIKRAKYRGWLRNLCVAMGNSGDARFVPKLSELAAHTDPIIREHAEWALEQIRSRES